MRNSRQAHFSQSGSDVRFRAARTCGMTGAVTKTHRYLRAWRKSQGLTLEELAEKIVSKPNTISGWETGLRRVNLDSLAEIAEVYGVRPEDLLGPPNAAPADPRIQRVSAIAVVLTDKQFVSWVGVGDQLAGRDSGRPDNIVSPAPDRPPHPTTGGNVAKIMAHGQKKRPEPSQPGTGSER